MHSECFIDGVFYPSVTTILGAKSRPWLDAWRAKWGILAERKVRISAALGHEFHRCIEAWLEKGMYTVSSPVDEDSGYRMPSLIPRIEGMMRSWVAWAESIDGIVRHTELQVISKKYLYSGTLDAIVELKNVR